MPEVVADEVVDRLCPVVPPGAFLTTVEPVADGARVPDALAAMCSLGSWRDALLLADGVAGGFSAATDHQGFSILDDGRVLLYDPLDAEAVVNRPALARLMVRLLDLAAADAAGRDDPVRAEPWWAEVAAVRQRLVSLTDGSG